jgi:hypothetical protein
MNASGDVERAGGVKYTVKNGIVYDAPALLARVRDTVTEERAKRAHAAAGRSGSG